MTTLRFNAPDGFKREFLEDGTIRATCDHCSAVLVGAVSTTGASQSQHRLTCGPARPGEQQSAKTDVARQGEKK